MLDRLDDIVAHYEEIMGALGEPGVTDDQKRFKALMKEQAELEPIVNTYKAYKDAEQAEKDSLEILDTESDEELR